MKTLKMSLSLAGFALSWLGWLLIVASVTNGKLASLVIGG